MTYEICGREFSYGDSVKILGAGYVFTEATDKGYMFDNPNGKSFLVTHAMAKTDNFVKHSWEKEDNINHPDRYCKGAIECIDAIETATSDLSGIEAFCTGNAIKYLWRWKTKEQVESLKKAVWYINHLIDYLDTKIIDDATKEDKEDARG